MPASSALRRGGFVVVEGLDGSGKTAVAHAVLEALQARGCDTLATREPGGTPIGEALRDVFLAYRDESDELCTKAEVLIVLAARAQHAHQCIRPAVERGDWVVSDRFNDSTYAYQGGGRGFDANTIEDVERSMGLDALVPDLVLLLDLPVEQAMQRLLVERPQRALFDEPNGDRFSAHRLLFGRPQRTPKKDWLSAQRLLGERPQGALLDAPERDRFFAQRKDFLQRVRDTYLARAQHNPSRYRVLDATRSVKEVCQEASAAAEACHARLDDAPAPA